MDTTESLPPSPDDPAEIAFRRGCQALGDRDQHERARGLFEEAVRGSGPQMLWRVAEACLEVEADQSAFWMSRAVVSESEPGGITVDPGALRILGGDGEMFQQHWEIAVESNDPARAVTALNAARYRLSRVFEDGREFPEEEFEDVIVNTELYSPNYVAVDETVPSAYGLQGRDVSAHGPHRPAHRGRRTAQGRIRQAHLFTPPPANSSGGLGPDFRTLPGLAGPCRARGVR